MTPSVSTFTVDDLGFVRRFGVCVAAELPMVGRCSLESGPGPSGGLRPALTAAAGRHERAAGRSNAEESGGVCWADVDRSAVPARVVGNAVDPAAVDNADPRASEHADRMRVVVAAGWCGLVGARGPGAGVTAVVGE